MLHLNMLLSKSSPTVLAGKRLFLVWVLMRLCSSAGCMDLFEQDPHFCTGASSETKITVIDFNWGQHQLVCLGVLDNFLVYRNA